MPSPSSIKHASKAVLPQAAAQSLVEIGLRLREARQRRTMSASELASRMNIDRRTLSQLEQGNPKVSLGTFFHALHMLDLLRGISEALQPENDIEAISLAVRQARRRGRPIKKIPDEKVNF